MNNIKRILIIVTFLIVIGMIFYIIKINIPKDENEVYDNIQINAEVDGAKYKIISYLVDDYSPDVILKVYKNDKEIEVKEIKYTDGVKICSGNNLVVNKFEFQDDTELIVVLKNGKEVKLNIEYGGDL